MQTEEESVERSKADEDVRPVITRHNIVVVVDRRKHAPAHNLRLQELLLAEDKLVSVTTAVDLNAHSRRQSRTHLE